MSHPMTLLLPSVIVFSLAIEQMLVVVSCTSGGLFFCTISNSTFYQEYMQGHGGGVMITYDDSSFTISNSTFSNNIADQGGVMFTW